MKRRPRKPPKVGKVYRLHSRTQRAALCLEVEGSLRLVFWDHGSLIVRHPLGSVGFNSEPSVTELLVEWGITLAELDAYVEAVFYRWQPDVPKVRAKEARML